MPGITGETLSDERSPYKLTVKNHSQGSQRSRPMPKAKPAGFCEPHHVFTHLTHTQELQTLSVVSSQPIRFVDLAGQFAEDSSDLVTARAEVLSSGDFIPGEGVGFLETEFAVYHGTTDAVGWGIRLDALTLTPQAAGVG